VKALNGIVIRIRRPSIENLPTNHESETHTFDVDAEVLNTSTLDRLKRDVMFTIQSFT
jgi:hypothetical protein